MPERVLDTSAWVALLDEEPAREQLLALPTAHLVTTTVVVAELAALGDLGRVRGDPAGDVQGLSRYEPTTRDDAVAGAAIYARLRRRGRRKLSLADALIYATARRIGAELVTFDGDLGGEPEVTVLPKARRRRA